jgi:hypothetical protein
MLRPTPHRAGTAAEKWASRIGLLTGLAAAAAIVVAFRIPAGDELPGASVRFTAAPTGELAVAPAVVVEELDLRPGALRSGRLTVRNLTGEQLAVRLNAATEDRELETSLRVEIAAARLHLFAGTLGELRRRGTRALVLVPAEARPLTIRVSLSDRADSAAARTAAVRLLLSSELVRPS